MDHPLGVVEREHGGQGLAAERDEAVGVVLEDPEAVLSRELDQPLPLGLGEGAAGRVVVVRDHVGELQGTGGERLLERNHVDAVLLERHRDQLDARPPEQEERAVVGRLLDGDPVAGLEEIPEEKGRRLHRPVGHHDPIRSDPVGLRSTRRGPGGLARTRTRGHAASRTRARGPPPCGPPRRAGCRRSERLGRS